MNSIGEVPASELIKEVASDLKGKLQKPKFSDFVKTGSHRDKAPQDRDWWFTRAASVLYRVYADGPVGTGNLRSYYGGKKRRGVKPPKFREASGKIIRLCLQQLEKEGLIAKAKKGRVLAPKGMSYLEKKSRELREKLVKLKVEQEAKFKAEREAVKAAAEKAAHEVQQKEVVAAERAKLGGGRHKQELQKPAEAKKQEDAAKPAEQKQEAPKPAEKSHPTVEAAKPVEHKPEAAKAHEQKHEAKPADQKHEASKPAEHKQHAPKPAEKPSHEQPKQ